MSRLIVILEPDEFDDVALRGKEYIVKPCEGRFASHTHSGAGTELKRSRDKLPLLHAIIGEHIIKPTIEEVFRSVNYSLVEPRASSLAEAIAVSLKRIGNKEAYIAFEVTGIQLTPQFFYTTSGNSSL